MRNTIRCCISCILPCGALDVIRIVHVTGHVDEISGSNTVTAADILKLYPKHVLKRPSSSATSAESCCPRIVVVPPEDELRRGKIYFLIPIPPPKSTSSSSSRRKKSQKKNITSNNATINSTSENDTASFLISDRYLSEILSEKMSTVKDRRRGRAGVWRPHLESISEAASADV